MSNLADLSRDLFGCILNDSVSSSTVIKLWACGNKKLCSKLADSVTHITLGGLLWLELKFPRLPLQLRSLRSLSLLSSDVRQISATSLLSLLTSLPPTLETLKILSNDSTALKQSLKDWNGKKMNLSTLFPRLHTLGLGTMQLETSAETAILPPTITHLEATLRLTYSRSTNHNNVISSLPRSLTRVYSVNIHYDKARPRTDSSAFLIQDWADAPPNFAEIDHLYFPFYVSDLSWIPRKMQHGTIADLGSRNSQQLQKLPPLLQTAEISSKDTPNSYPDWKLEVPKSLTSLALGTPIISFPEHLVTLPRTLTELSFAHVAQSMEPLRSYMSSISLEAWRFVWPPHLTSMTWPWGQVTPSDINMLPKTLLQLTLGVKPESGDAENIRIDSSYLPPSLTSLSLHACAADFVTFTNKMPPLTRLSLAGDVWDRRILEHFPSTLVSFSMDRTFSQLEYYDYLITNDLKPWLFKNLTLLAVPEWTLNWFQFLPRTLESFTAHNTWASGTYNRDLDSNDLIEGYYAHLPSTLTYLKLNGHVSTNSPFCKASPLRLFSHLTQLRHLSLDMGRGISSFRLRDLPRSLIWLQMGLDDLLKSDAPFIPPLLTYFGGVPQSCLKPFLVPYWPIACFDMLLRESRYGHEMNDLVKERILATTKLW